MLPLKSKKENRREYDELRQATVKKIQNGQESIQSITKQKVQCQYTINIFKQPLNERSIQVPPYSPSLYYTPYRAKSSFPKEYFKNPDITNYEKKKKFEKSLKDLKNELLTIETEINSLNAHLIKLNSYLKTIIHIFNQEQLQRPKIDLHDLVQKYELLCLCEENIIAENQDKIIELKQKKTTLISKIKDLKIQLSHITIPDFQFTPPTPFTYLCIDQRVFTGREQIVNHKKNLTNLEIQKEQTWNKRYILMHKIDQLNRYLAQLTALSKTASPYPSFPIIKLAFGLILLSVLIKFFCLL
ncbi:hypothetical protein AYO37_00495 [Opitutia bacterium SCGC AG-212-L18]|nr:hypothetical protein AYO37_00495 [Opitutae bacterium SCGC AG-212-L18]